MKEKEEVFFGKVMTGSVLVFFACILVSLWILGEGLGFFCGIVAGVPSALIYASYHIHKRSN